MAILQEYPELTRFLQEPPKGTYGCSLTENSPQLTANITNYYHTLTRILFATLLQQLKNSQDSLTPDLTTLLTRFQDAMELHLQKEEQILFPMIEQVAQSTELNAKQMLECPLRVMDQEHREHTQTLHKVIQLEQQCSDPSIKELLTLLIHLTKEHVSIEDDYLFPRIKAM